MIFAEQLLIHTPIWLYGLLGYLIYLGIKAMRPRTVTIWRMLIVPVVFVTMGLMTILARHAGLPVLLVWLGALLLVAPLGYLTSPRLLAVDPEERLVRRPGSIVPLIRNVGVFVLQYVFAVAAILHPDENALLFLVGRAVSGATAGYFVGWAVALRGHYRTAPKLSLKAA